MLDGRCLVFLLYYVLMYIDRLIATICFTILFYHRFTDFMLGVGCWVLDAGCWMLGVWCGAFGVGREIMLVGEFV